MKFRSGFIAIIGRPNVGKSTLLNAILGEKVAIVSDRPQTTRNRMRGIKNRDGSQIVFIDTPGLHGKEGLMNAFMVKEALASLSEVDGVLFMVEANRHSNKDKSKERDSDEALIIENLKRVKAPVTLVINKIDKISRDELLPVIDDYSARFPFKEVVPISATKAINVDELISSIEKLPARRAEDISRTIYLPTPLSEASRQRLYAKRRFAIRARRYPTQ